MVDMNKFNVSATLNIFRVLFRPSLCLPQATISTFNQLPIPVDKAFAAKYGKADIRAVVLDKDNCFAQPGKDEVYKEYEETFARLRSAYPGKRLLIVSNSSGTSSLDPTLSKAKLLTVNTGIPVLSHSTKKPGCGTEIMDYFLNNPETGVTRPDQIAVVGDRLSTDVVMANLMGSYGVWVRDGVLGDEGNGKLVKMEQRVAAWLFKKGFEAPSPKSPFEQ